MKTFIISALALASIALPTYGQEFVEDTHETIKARVVEVLYQGTEEIAGTDSSHTVQTVAAELLSGSDKGERIEIRNDYVMLDEGDTFYLTRTVPWDGGEPQYMVSEPNRLPFLAFLGILFVALTVLFGGKQGIRGLASLAASLFLIAFVLLPGIMKGYSPVAVSIGVSALIIVLGSYVTHGFNKTTTAAVMGMIATILLIGFFAHWSIGAARLTGMSEEEAVYLSFNSAGTLDLAGLLLGGMLIGLLGVLYDAAISQAIAVEELHRVAPHLSRKSIYKRATRIGREHIGALVDTLAIAYVGVSLPLLLLFYSSAFEPAHIIMNREIFASEIVRAIVGSIGLILTVPLTTLISTWMLIKRSGHADPATLAKEEESLKHAGHHHHH
ncbi:MAG: YibE/F family protein [Candidatus Taylorbacteria bacterium]|nr:YibE/F family protein [Candidatus Taylorbacteria bacterium]